MAAADKERRGAFFVISQPGQSVGTWETLLYFANRQKLIFENGKKKELFKIVFRFHLQVCFNSFVL